MKHFLSALALGGLLLSCNRGLENNENNETPAPPKEERLVLASLYEFGSNVRFQYKNGNEINRMAMDGPHGEASMDFEYDTYGRIVKERRFHHRSDYGETIITYQYDNQSRLTSSHAISTQYYPDTGYTPRCSVEKKHTYTYQGNKVIVKIEMGADTCSAIPETGKEKTITLFVENGKVVKSLDENNQIIETIEYLNTKNTLRNMKGFPALVVEFYIRPFTYELPFYNGIEHIEDLRFIDNIKTRDFHNGSYWEYRYSYDKGKSHDNDYLEIEEVNIYEKSHNDPTHDNYLSSASPARFYTKEK